MVNVADLRQCLESLTKPRWAMRIEPRWVMRIERMANGAYRIQMTTGIWRLDVVSVSLEDALCTAARDSAQLSQGKSDAPEDLP